MNLKTLEKLEFNKICNILKSYTITYIGNDLAENLKPLSSKKERSNLKFGDYIHKYFYDKSIADGYTLRIKKEPVQTKVKKDLKKNLKLLTVVKLK